MIQKKAFSLVYEPNISCQTISKGNIKYTLPQVLAGLGGNDIISFDHLQVHQKQAWYCFLVQLAAIILHKTGTQDILNKESEWRNGLLKLTEGSELPWCLVVEEVSEPAFLQPPVPEGSFEKAGYKQDITTPDELDILVTSKNHDIKRHRISNPRIENWLFSLITLQTMGGGLGRGNYGIVRMNSFYGTRSMVGFSPGLGWGERFVRDVTVLCNTWEELSKEYKYSKDGKNLLWLLPWDGKKTSGIPLNKCSPFFIEICRRIRFIEIDGALQCWRANTDCQRIKAPDNLKGITGDPWSPIDKKKGKALTLSGKGFSYDLVKDILLSGDYVQPAALQKTDSEQKGGYLIGTALVRGQGKTDGFHHRIIPVPPKAGYRIFDSPSEREKLAQRAQDRVNIASTVQRNVLYPALQELLKAGSNERIDPVKLNRWTKAFNSQVDEVFFKDLWDSLEYSPEEAMITWQQRLFDFAEEQFHNAMHSSPIPSIRQYRAISDAESIFYGSAKKHLINIFDNSNQEKEHEPITG